MEDRYLMRTINISAIRYPSIEMASYFKRAISDFPHIVNREVVQELAHTSAGKWSILNECKARRAER